MKYGFLDREDAESPIERFDPRARLAFFFGAAVLVASEPPGALERFPAYAALVGLLTTAARTSPQRILARLALASPFVLLAAVLPFLALLVERNGAWREAGLFAGSVLLRSYTAIALLALLTATTGLAQIVWALQQLRAPHALTGVITLMYRYVFVLLDEWRRLTQARQCRSAGRLRVNRMRLLATQVAMVFIRGWERAERVHAAMTVRGFTGRLPVRRTTEFSWRDAAFVILGLGAFGAVRFAFRAETAI